MEPPHASATIAAATSPRPPAVPSKIRLMCSYGGHIVPRPHDKSLFYAGGETRIVAVDRRTTAVSLFALSAHLSRALFSNRPFHLKYQLPNEDLDSLISVITDEDLSNMLEEHDRIVPPDRIRLFLFPVKPESIGSALLDPKSETWFSDALKSTGVLQKGQSEDSGFLLGIGSNLDAPDESGSNGGGGGVEVKLGAESLVLETSSSFGSTNSSFSMSNSAPIGVNQCDDKGLNLLDTKIRVLSPAAIESETIPASLSSPQKPGILQDPLIKIDREISSKNTIPEPLLNLTTHNLVQVHDYPLPQLPDQKNQQQLTRGGLQYQCIPQYPSPMPIQPYYPVYQMTMQPQHISSCQSNQPYPVYLVPVRPPHYPDMSMPYNSVANTTNSSILPPSHSQIATQKEIANLPSNQGQVLGDPPEPKPVDAAAAADEFDENIVYNQIYKSQPLPPIVTTTTMTKGTTMLMGLVPPYAQVQQKKPC